MLHTASVHRVLLQILSGISCLKLWCLQVTDAERRLRGALVLDGLEAEEGYKLARYNDPFTPPFLRRNEILIRLKDYELEQAD